ncbi:uncharacterized protein LOC132620383 isoform X2 [Lycium barbarum]|uniref:uncharacterized protein LOC132620383 isoform X2 n=1 Tax=Lycium barbarum TaxID=112863 RepID=UPI00293E55FD|nr:uncharacterized protein LOC132620383 isoform X2 [Lycium barbarum]
MRIIEIKEQIKDDTPCPQKTDNEAFSSTFEDMLNKSSLKNEVAEFNNFRPFLDIKIMGDSPRGIEIFEDHFQASTSGEDSVQIPASSKYVGSNDSLRSWTRRKLKGAASTLKLFSPSKLTWMSGIDGQEKVVLTAAEVESLRSEIPALEERKAHFKTQVIMRTLRKEESVVGATSNLGAKT